MRAAIFYSETTLNKIYKSKFMKANWCQILHLMTLTVAVGVSDRWQVTYNTWNVSTGKIITLDASWNSSARVMHAFIDFIFARPVWIQTTQ